MMLKRETGEVGSSAQSAEWFRKTSARDWTDAQSAAWQFSCALWAEGCVIRMDSVVAKAEDFN
jgi:hypothetical protein